MKKTFTINISGIIFHIDDDAYSKLNAYLDSIKSHFKNLDGSDEIIGDIEGRIAEILQSKLTDTKQVIVIADVNDVIERMGQPSDFVEDIEEDESNFTTGKGYKRLYRNIDDRIIGGVSGGIGAYLNIDPLWIRIAFIISIFTTLGIPIYLILWIALPEARTAAERLEMRGRKVTISNIEKSVKKEFEGIKERFSEYSDQAKDKYKKESVHTKNFFDSLLSGLGDILRFIGRGFVILLGIIFLIIGFSFVIGIIGGLFGFAHFGGHENIISFTGMYELFFYSIEGRGLFSFGLFLFIGIPIFMLIYHGIRFLFGFERIKNFGSYAFIFWLMGLVFTAVFAFKVAKNFFHDENIDKEMAIEAPTTNTIYIKGNTHAKDFVNARFLEIDNFEVGITEDYFFVNEINLHIRPSKTNSYELTKNYYSTGRTRREAHWKAEQMEYNVIQNDSIFTFDLFYKIDKELGFSGQNIDVVLRIPIGTKVKLDRNIRENVRPYYWYRYRDYIYVMTEDGLRPEESVEEN